MNSLLGSIPSRHCRRIHTRNYRNRLLPQPRFFLKYRLTRKHLPILNLRHISRLSRGAIPPPRQGKTQPPYYAPDKQNKKEEGVGVGTVLTIVLIFFFIVLKGC